MIADNGSGYGVDAPPTTLDEDIVLYQGLLEDNLKLRESMRGDMHYTTTVMGIRYREDIISRIEGLQLHLERLRKWKEEQDG